MSGPRDVPTAATALPVVDRAREAVAGLTQEEIVRGLRDGSLDMGLMIGAAAELGLIKIDIEPGERLYTSEEVRASLLGEAEADTPDALDPGLFQLVGGKRKTVDVAAVADQLNLRVVKRGRLASGSFTYSGESLTLAPDTLVHVRQATLKKDRVQEYVDALRRGEVLPGPSVTDRVEGSLHHLDGLHRLVAHRLLGMATDARIWR